MISECVNIQRFEFIGFKLEITILVLFLCVYASLAVTGVPYVCYCGKSVQKLCLFLND